MSRQTPPLKNLIAFEVAARLGSFSKAADELAITQSAVSQQVQKLEQHVGQPLFLRTGSGVVLTAAGEILSETVAETLSRLSHGLDRIEPYRNKNSIILGLPSDFAHGWLTPNLEKLRGLNKAFEVWLVINRPIREIDQIDMDLIISRQPIHTADIECIPFMEDVAVAVCAPRIAERIRNYQFPKLVEGVPLIFLEDQPDWNGLLTVSGIQKNRLIRSATVDDALVALDAAAAGSGIAYLPYRLCQDAIHAGRVEILKNVPTKSLARFWLMRSRKPPRTPFTETVFNWLLQEATKETSGQITVNRLGEIPAAKP